MILRSLFSPIRKYAAASPTLSVYRSQNGISIVLLTKPPLFVNIKVGLAQASPTLHLLSNQGFSIVITMMAKNTSKSPDLRLDFLSNVQIRLQFVGRSHTAIPDTLRVIGAGNSIGNKNSL